MSLSARKLGSLVDFPKPVDAVNTTQCKFHRALQTSAKPFSIATLGSSVVCILPLLPLLPFLSRCEFFQALLPARMPPDGELNLKNELTCGFSSGRFDKDQEFSETRSRSEVDLRQSTSSVSTGTTGAQRRERWLGKMKTAASSAAERITCRI